MMDIQFRDKILSTLCSMSDQQIDPQLKGRLRKLIGRDNHLIKNELLQILDDAVHYSWCSNFEIEMMDFIWRQIGGTEQELIDRRTV